VTPVTVAIVAISWAAIGIAYSVLKAWNRSAK
jgi:hypothetical protein